MNPTARLRDLSQLVKLRLSLTVVFSAALAYLIAHPQHRVDAGFWTLLLGGFLVTAASNGLNEWWEAPYDALMKRTAQRPLPSQRVQALPVLLGSLLVLAVGVAVLAWGNGAWAAGLAAASAGLYVLAYTPLKRVSPLAVPVGAIPGALPPAIGATAALGEPGLWALLLFALQFVWQMPHFWAIGMLGADEYAKAGFRLTRLGGSERLQAHNVALYALLLLPVGSLPWVYGLSGPGAQWGLLAAGLLLLLLALRLWAKPGRGRAVGVLLGSIAYLPVVYLSLFFDQILS